MRYILRKKSPKSLAMPTLLGHSLLAGAVALFCGCSDPEESADEQDTSADTGTEQDIGVDSDTGTAEDDSDTQPEVDPNNACADVKLRPIPQDLGAVGPWPVGARTTNIFPRFKTEVWYPAVPGSESGKQKKIYDIRDHIPRPEMVSDEENPIQECNCYADLPLDEDYGPYPAVVFVHGTAGFRTQNMEQMQHWASRGFIVLASDHPGITFKDIVNLGLGGSNQASDARRVLKAMEDPTGDIEFLKGNVNPNCRGAMGHSAGAGAITGLGNIAKVLIPYAGGAGVTPAPDSVLFIVGSQDMGGGGADATFNSAKPTKRSVVVTDGGHIVGSSLCVLRDPRNPGRDLLDIIQDRGVGGMLGSMAGGLFQGCNEVADNDNGNFINELTGIEIFNYATAGVLEETLHGSTTAAVELSKIKEVFGEHITTYKEKLE